MGLAKKEIKEGISAGTLSATDTKGRGPQVSGQEDRLADEHDKTRYSESFKLLTSEDQRIVSILQLRF